jgi:YggT family protein
MESFGDSLIQVISSMLRLFSLMVVTYAMLSWIIADPRHPVYRFLQGMVEPILNPIRKIIPPIAGFDISIIAVLMGIEMLRSFLLY